MKLSIYLSTCFCLRRSRKLEIKDTDTARAVESESESWSRSRSFGKFSLRGVGVTEIFKALRSREKINRLESESEFVKNARTPTPTALKFKLETNAFKYYQKLKIVAQTHTKRDF